MKQFSIGPYFVVGFAGGGCLPHAEVRFVTLAGAMKHARRLVSYSIQQDGNDERHVFVDRVLFAKPGSGDREESGTNRIKFRQVDAQGRVWVWDGARSWQHKTTLQTPWGICRSV
jgi:hypothetical protein